jgi:hypothetical protein
MIYQACGLDKKIDKQKLVDFLAEMERFTNSCVRENWVRKYNFCYAHAMASLRSKLAEFCINTTSRTKRGITQGDTSFCWQVRAE